LFIILQKTHNVCTLKNKLWFINHLKLLTSARYYARGFKKRTARFRAGGVDGCGTYNVLQKDIAGQCTVGEDLFYRMITYSPTFPGFKNQAFFYQISKIFLQVVA